MPHKPASKKVAESGSADDHFSEDQLICEFNGAYDDSYRYRIELDILNKMFTVKTCDSRTKTWYILELDAIGIKDLALIIKWANKLMNMEP